MPRCTPRPLRRWLKTLALLLLAAHTATAQTRRDVTRSDVLTLSTNALPPLGYTVLPYANPNAPKGGAFTISTVGGFDNLNPFILRGTAPSSIYRVWQPLFKSSDTDTVTAYAELARAVLISPDHLTVTFQLDPRARFSDGTKVTAADVLWTFNTLVTQGSPFYAGYYAGVAAVRAPDDETIVFTLKPGAGADLPSNLAGMYVLPEHFWQGRDFAAPLLSPPIGSGPYRISAVAFGRAITYTRVQHWWAETLPSDRGFYNFDTYTEQFFQSDAVALQAFKAGQIDARVETSAKTWATGYDFPDARNGAVQRVLVPLGLPAGMYGLVMNTRHPLFANPKLRQALTLAFDFEWMNRVLFYSSYERTLSYFANSPLASSGLPSAAELKLLAPYRAQIPNAVFTTPYTLPVTDGSGYNTAQLKQAMDLLNAAGWRLKNFHLVNSAGTPLAFEILLDDQRFNRIAIAYAADLQKLGITATVRVIDPATYQRRLDNFDFDMTPSVFPETDFPGTEQGDYWGCTAARTQSSNNLAGICTPAIDAMIKAQNAATDPAQKTAAIHALDRLLLNGWYIVPWFHADHERLAYRRQFQRPAAPLQIGYDYDLWWQQP